MNKQMNTYLIHINEGTTLHKNTDKLAGLP